MIFLTQSNFVKLRLQNAFRPHVNVYSSILKSIFEKLRYRDGLMCTICLTAQIKRLFLIPLAQLRVNFCFVFVSRRRISDNSRHYSNYKWHTIVGVCILLGVVNKMYYITEGERFKRTIVCCGTKPFQSLWIFTYGV